MVIRCETPVYSGVVNLGASFLGQSALTKFGCVLLSLRPTMEVAGIPHRCEHCGSAQ